MSSHISKFEFRDTRLLTCCADFAKSSNVFEPLDHFQPEALLHFLNKAAVSKRTTRVCAFLQGHDLGGILLPCVQFGLGLEPARELPGGAMALAFLGICRMSQIGKIPILGAPTLAWLLSLPLASQNRSKMVR